MCVCVLVVFVVFKKQHLFLQSSLQCLSVMCVQVDAEESTGLACFCWRMSSIFKCSILIVDQCKCIVPLAVVMNMAHLEDFLAM